LAGLNTSNDLPETGATHFPPIKFCFGFASHAARLAEMPGTEFPRVECPLPLEAGVTARVDLALRMVV
jgi:hypothetical protein